MDQNTLLGLVIFALVLLLDLELDPQTVDVALVEVGPSASSLSYSTNGL